MDCLFCKIKNKEIEAKVLYEDDDFFVFLDMDQSYGGHTLIIPKKHFTTYKDLDNITLNKMFLLASKISDEIMQKLNKKGISLQFNYGDTQVVKHVHLHLIPNYELEKDNMDINEVYHLLGSTIKVDISSKETLEIISFIFSIVIFSIISFSLSHILLNLDKV